MMNPSEVKAMRGVRGRGRSVFTVGRLGRLSIIVAGLGALVVVAPAATRASYLLAPAVGVSDAATAGSRIADPPTPSSALFENPAGLTAFDTVVHGGGIGVTAGTGRIRATNPSDYNETYDMHAGVPDFGLSIPIAERWRFAVGSYGTTGSTFNFPAIPAIGGEKYFSETIVMAVPLGLGYRANEHLSLGMELQPMFGQIRAHYPTPMLNFRYRINGPGVQGMVGMSYRFSEEWTLGVGVRTPGLIWMRGSMPAGSERQDVMANLQMPAQAFVGTTWRGIPRLALSASARFTNSTTMGASIIQFDLMPQANAAIVPRAKDETKFALGAEYEVIDTLMLRTGVAYANHIVGTPGANPLVYDTDDTKLSWGFGKDFGGWKLDGTLGYGIPAERHIAASPIFPLPATYSTEGFIFFLGVTFRG